MALALTQREKNLLGACIAALVLMATFIILKQFLDRRTAALAKISALEAEKQENEGYLADREFWDATQPQRQNPGAPPWHLGSVGRDVRISSRRTSAHR